MARIGLVIGGELESLPSSINQEEIVISSGVTFGEAKEIALSMQNDMKVEIIISPSGTSVVILDVLQVPVIVHDISQFEILQTIMKAHNDNLDNIDEIAVVLHENTYFSATEVQPFVDRKIESFTYTTESSLRSLLSQLLLDGYKIFVGGPTCVQVAETHSRKGYVLRISSETIMNSIDKAKEVLKTIDDYNKKNQLIQSAIELLHSGVLILDNEEKITQSNAIARDFFKSIDYESESNDLFMADLLKSEAPVIRNNIKKIGDKSFFFNRSPVILDDQIIGSIVTLMETETVKEMDSTLRRYRTDGFLAKYTFQDIVGKSKSLKETILIAKAFARADADILIVGETGTGKELFAQSIHNSSHRAESPFVAINCGAFPETLLESELFGYEGGAFTGARKEGKEGLFELAHGGTLFLDEIQHLTPRMQSRLLRVLQEREVFRIGAKKVISVDLRVICATNASLSELISTGEFRKDLYYRISVLEFIIPPLRDRIEDLSMLIDYFFSIFQLKYGKVKKFSEQDIVFLQQHNWMGNTRELMNLIERYVIIAQTLSVSPSAFLQEYFLINKSATQNQKNLEGSRGNLANNCEDIIIQPNSLKEMKKQIIKVMLEREDGNRTITAQNLGISRSTLWRTLNEK